MQSILGLFGRHKPSAQEEQEEAEHLQTLVNSIFDKFFGSFVQEYAASKRLAEEDAKKEPFGLFEKGIAVGFKTEHPTAAQALQARFHAKEYHNNERCKKIIRQLEALFSYKQQKAPLIPVNVDRKILTVIAFALQETVFGIPKIMYSGTEQVPENVEDRLSAILKYIDSMGLLYKLQAPLLDQSDASIRLNQEIAQVDGYLFLPLKRLPTAALTQDDLKDFYVMRRFVDVDNLARSIVRNDGVILIAGYRGVGKSTYINAAKEKLPEIEKLQHGNEQRRIVPITINVAKIAGDAGALNVLRLCIRSLYDAFLGVEPAYPHTDLEKLLDKSDQHLLKWAHLRASYKVDMTQGESVSSLRNLEVSLDLKPGDLIPKPISGGILGSLLPGFSGKYGKEWKKQVEQTIALLDYDADRAEEDIISIIEQFYKPGIQRKTRIKLAFIFDEMDKLELEEVEILIKQLKNLFLTRNAVFLLVTGKEVYYKRMQSRKDEDSPFSSYFSRVVTVPLFTANETNALLEKLWLKDQASLSAREKAFIQTLACHLTYHARGVPREIIRELQDLQQWEKDTLQSYVTDSSDWVDQFQVYADLQKVIEGVVNDVPNKQWQEQIERGLYVLIEEFLDQKNVVLDIEEFLDQKNVSPVAEMSPVAKMPPFQAIRKNNFKFVPVKDLKDVIDLLKVRLPSVPIFDANNPDLKKTLFSLPSTPTTTQGNVLVMTVDDLFYKLTGRSTSTSSPELEGEEVNLTIEEINAYLKQQQSRYRWKQAFSALHSKQGEGYTADTYEQLYRIFTDVSLPGEYTDFRLLAAHYLTGDAFFERAMVQIPQRFIDEETNEQLLRSFIQHVQEGSMQGGTDEQAKRRDEGKQMLLNLLNRHKSASESTSSTQQLPKSILTDLISALSLVTDTDILEQVVASLDLQQDVSDVLPALQRLEQKSQQRLIDVLLAHDFQAIGPNTLLSILSSDMSQDTKRLNAIWSLAVSQKKRKLAQQLMSAIIQQWSSSNMGKEAILQWVDGSDWDIGVDKPILSEAVVQNRTYFSSLSKPTSLDSPTSLAKGRLTEILKETKPPEPPPPPIKTAPQEFADALRGIPLGKRSSTPTETLPISNGTGRETRQSAQSRTLRGWLIALAMLGILAVYFAVRLDLPANTTLVHQLLARFLEAIYVYGSVFGIYILFIAIIDDVDRGFFIGIGIGLLVTAVVCFFLQIKFFPLAFTFWGQFILIALLGAFWLPLLALLLPSQSTSESS